MGGTTAGICHRKIALQEAPPQGCCYRAECLTLGSVNIAGQRILCCGGCLVHCWIFLKNVYLKNEESWTLIALQVVLVSAVWGESATYVHISPASQASPHLSRSSQSTGLNSLCSIPGFYQGCASNTHTTSYETQNVSALGQKPPGTDSPSCQTQSR